jgi:hypothetical protein
VFLASVFQHAQRMRRVVMWPLWLYHIFSKISYKGNDFQKRVIDRKMCVLIFSTTLSETFLILRRFQRDIVIYVHRSSCKIPVILIRFKEILTFSADFRQRVKYQISQNSIQWEPSCSIRTDGRTERRRDKPDEANSQVSQFCERA